MMQMIAGMLLASVGAAIIAALRAPPDAPARALSPTRRAWLLSTALVSQTLADIRGVWPPPAIALGEILQQIDDFEAGRTRECPCCGARRTGRR